jgi:nitroreductase
MRNPAATSTELDKEAKKPLRAPLIVVVSAPVKPHPKAPAIEQIVSAGCAVQNILLALHARGYAGMWRTGAPAYDPHVKGALGLSPEDAIVAFLYAGTPASPPPATARPVASEHVSEWSGPAR